MEQTSRPGGETANPHHPSSWTELCQQPMAQSRICLATGSYIGYDCATAISEYHCIRRVPMAATKEPGFPVVDGVRR
jgi:hypothetical protein